MPVAVLFKVVSLTFGCFSQLSIQPQTFSLADGYFISFSIGLTLPYVNATTGVQDFHSTKALDQVILMQEFIFRHVMNLL